jgi:hypothetical protein
LKKKSIKNKRKMNQMCVAMGAGFDKEDYNSISATALREDCSH